MNEERKCIVCGSLFSGRRMSPYCSRKCQLQARYLREKERDREEMPPKEENTKKEKKDQRVSFSMILKGMEETGLSYGAYVARFVKEET